MSLLRDEKGSISTARVLLCATSLFLFALIWADAKRPGFDVPEQAYQILTTMLTGFLIWAAGPRHLQYLSGHATKALEVGRDVAAKVSERLKGGK